MTDSCDELMQTDRAPVTCPIGKREDCEFFHITYIPETSDHMDDGEYYCNHPDLDEEIKEEYCPILAEEMEEP